MRGLVYNNGILAGFLERNEADHYIFQYEDSYFLDKQQPPVSLTLSKDKKTHHSSKLFSFFYGLLSEGINKEIQCRLYKIDENDDFTRLLLSSREDNIGSITIKPEDDEVFRLLY